MYNFVPLQLRLIYIPYTKGHAFEFKDIFLIVLCLQENATMLVKGHRAYRSRRTHDSENEYCARKSNLRHLIN
jgi:hypothetical protein